MISRQEAIRVLEKLGFVPRKGGKELRYKYVHDDITILSTSIPKGRGDLYIRDKVRKQIALDNEQFMGALSCPFKAAHYLAHLFSIERIQKREAPTNKQRPAARSRRRRKR